MADEDPLVLKKQQPFRRFLRAAVAVARHLIKLDFRAGVAEPFAVPPAIPQVEDHPGRLPFHRLQHIGKISVRIRKDKDLHNVLLSVIHAVYAIFRRDAMGAEQEEIR